MNVIMRFECEDVSCTCLMHVSTPEPYFVEALLHHPVSDVLRFRGKALVGVFCGKPMALFHPVLGRMFDQEFLICSYLFTHSGWTITVISSTPGPSSPTITRHHGAAPRRNPNFAQWASTAETLRVDAVWVSCQAFIRIHHHSPMLERNAPFASASICFIMFHRLLAEMG